MSFIFIKKCHFPITYLIDLNSINTHQFHLDKFQIIKKIFLLFYH